MKTIKFICLVLVVFAVSLGCIFPKVVVATNDDTRVILPVYADTNLNDNEIKCLKEAIEAWNSTEYGKFFEYKGQANKWWFILDLKVIVVTKGKTEGSDVLANTVSDRSKYLNRNLIIIDKNENFGENGYSLKSILMHELFHTVGLNSHTDSKASVFYSKYTGKTQFVKVDLDLISTLK